MPAVRTILILAVAVCAALAGCAGPDEPSAVHLARAADRLEDGKYLTARKEISAAIQADPARLDTYTSAIALYSSYKCYSDAAHVGDALLERLQSGKVNRKLSKDELVSTYTTLGMVYQEVSNLPKAEDAYKLALEIAPDVPTLLNNLGWFYADQGIKLDKALRLTEKAAMLAPYDGNIIDSLGWAQFKLGRYNAAVRTLRRAVELEPDTAELRYHLGAAYVGIGRRTQARIELHKALILDPNMTEVSVLLKTLQK